MLIKSDAARKDTSFEINDVKKLVEESLANVTQENWRKVVLHTIKVEKTFCEVDFGEEGLHQVNKVIIL